MEQSKASETLESLKFHDFLRDRPPGSAAAIPEGRSTYSGRLMPPTALRLWCSHSDCDDITWYDVVDGSDAVTSDGAAVLRYLCRHCKSTRKMYALLVVATDNDRITVVKYGEVPPFGVPLPSRLLRLAGPDAPMLKKGRRSENQGLGIGALAYYRRVVENQKDRLFQQIIEVARTVGAPPEVISKLEAARVQKQFATGMEAVGPAVPESLLVHGANPLTLLHRALSVGIHSMTDQECLNVASSIRTVLTELTDRMSFILSEDEELAQAVKNLAKPAISNAAVAGTDSNSKQRRDTTAERKDSL